MKKKKFYGQSKILNNKDKFKNELTKSRKYNSISIIVLRILSFIK